MSDDHLTPAEFRRLTLFEWSHGQPREVGSTDQPQVELGNEMGTIYLCDGHHGEWHRRNVMMAKGSQLLGQPVRVVRPVPPDQPLTSSVRRCEWPYGGILCAASPTGYLSEVAYMDREGRYIEERP